MKSNASITRGTLCAMIYVFDDIEEMQACCGLPHVEGLRAWETHTEAAASVPAGGQVKGVSLGEFQTSILELDHADELTSFCFFLIANGSGTGACSCGSGDSFSQAPEPIFQ